MLAMMVDLEDDDEWAMADELEDDDFDRYCPPPPIILWPCAHFFISLSGLCSNAVAGESALDRIACGLGGKIILPMIKQHIIQMLHNSKSRKLLFPNVRRRRLTSPRVCRQPTGSTATRG